MGDKRSLVFRVFERKIQVGFRRHIEKRNLDGPERLLDIASEFRRCSYIVVFPSAHLAYQIVRISSRNKSYSEAFHHALECGSGRGVRSPKAPFATIPVSRATRPKPSRTRKAPSAEEFCSRRPEKRRPQSRRRSALPGARSRARTFWPSR